MNDMNSVTQMNSTEPNIYDLAIDDAILGQMATLIDIAVDVVAMYCKIYNQQLPAWVPQAEAEIKKIEAAIEKWNTPAVSRD